MKEIPVVIAHFGTKPHYLKLALQSAAKFNKNVVLIGDAANQGFWNSHWETVPTKIDKFQEFLKHYVHMSSFSEEYEVSCFKRMFAMEEWMKQNSLTELFHLDSDVMTFANYSKEVLPVLPEDCLATLMTMEGQDTDYAWSSSIHFSYLTLEALEDFTNYCIEAYRGNHVRILLETKWKWHKDHNKGGGITDMTLLYHWGKNNPRILNFTKIYNGMTADYNFNLAEQYYKNEYQKELGLKKFIFKDGLPYGFNTRSNTWIRFLCIHCQGAGKYAMPYLKNEYLRRFYIVTRILHRIKSKYFKFSFNKLKKKMSRK